MLLSCESACSHIESKRGPAPNQAPPRQSAFAPCHTKTTCLCSPMQSHCTHRHRRRGSLVGFGDFLRGQCRTWKALQPCLAALLHHAARLAVRRDVIRPEGLIPEDSGRGWCSIFPRHHARTTARDHARIRTPRLAVSQRNAQIWLLAVFLGLGLNLPALHHRFFHDRCSHPPESQTPRMSLATILAPCPWQWSQEEMLRNNNKKTVSTSHSPAPPQTQHRVVEAFRVAPAVGPAHSALNLTPARASLRWMRVVGASAHTTGNRSPYLAAATCRARR